jgi:prepilin-type N-terminal cleavage/methylation domain-containing protein
MGNGKWQAAFTLIELLVVISVISILMGILLPSLRAIRRQGKNIKCLHNVRQLGYAVQLYLEDSRDVCPPWIAKCKCPPPAHPGWWSSVHYLVQVYLDDATQVWECPADDTEDCTPWDGGHNGGDTYDRARRRCGYLYNNAGGTGGVGSDEGLSFWGNWSYGKSFDTIEKPSRKISMFCWSAHNFWPSGGVDRDQWWHSDRPQFRVPVAFLDYHAAIVALVPKEPETDQYKW